MIYTLPSPESPTDQGDIVDGCPLLEIVRVDLQSPQSPEVVCSIHRVVVLTQTCDLVNQKTQYAVVAMAHDAAQLVAQNIVKAADVRGPIRASRVYGWYFLPAASEFGLEEMIVDLMQLFTVPLTVFRDLAAAGNRKARIQPLYREHLARHFADTYSRIGLPEPYATE